MQKMVTGKYFVSLVKFSKIKDEVLYWKDVVEEIRRNNPELERSLKDAKETFVNRKNQR